MFSACTLVSIGREERGKWRGGRGESIKGKVEERRGSGREGEVRDMGGEVERARVEKRKEDGL